MQYQQKVRKLKFAISIIIKQDLIVLAKCCTKCNRIYFNSIRIEAPWGQEFLSLFTSFAYKQVNFWITKKQTNKKSEASYL